MLIPIGLYEKRGWLVIVCEAWLIYFVNLGILNKCLSFVFFVLMIYRWIGHVCLHPYLRVSQGSLICRCWMLLCFHTSDTRRILQKWCWFILACACACPYACYSICFTHILFGASTFIVVRFLCVSLWTYYFFYKWLVLTFSSRNELICYSSAPLHNCAFS